MGMFFCRARKDVLSVKRREFFSGLFGDLGRALTPFQRIVSISPTLCPFPRLAPSCPALRLRALQLGLVPCHAAHILHIHVAPHQTTCRIPWGPAAPLYRFDRSVSLPFLACFLPF